METKSLITKYKYLAVPTSTCVESRRYLIQRLYSQQSSEHTHINIPSKPPWTNKQSIGQLSQKPKTSSPPLPLRQTKIQWESNSIQSNPFLHPLGHLATPNRRQIPTIPCINHSSFCLSAPSLCNMSHNIGLARLSLVSLSHERPQAWTSILSFPWEDEERKGRRYTFPWWGERWEMGRWISSLIGEFLVLVVEEREETNFSWVSRSRNGLMIDGWYIELKRRRELVFIKLFTLPLFRLLVSSSISLLVRAG